MEENRSETSQSHRPELDSLMGEFEQRFKQGMGVVSQWGNYAREAMRKQPGAVLAGVAVLGFATGLLLRRLAADDEDR